MKARRAANSFTGAALFFVTMCIVVSVAVSVYAVTERASGGNKGVIAGVMFAVIVALSGACTLVDFLRRRYTVDKPVTDILNATDKIATGDFNVKLVSAHSVNRYNEYDCIKENINKMAAQLRKTEMLNNDFIANVSHEIKTPISVIKNYSTVLFNACDGENKKYAQTVCDAAVKLGELVTNVLKLNKLENKEIQPEYTSINLADSIAESVIGFEDLIESKSLELNCDLCENAFTRSHNPYLQIIWNNLLSNAIKFTPQGGKINVSLTAKNGYATVTVADSGCGISPEAGSRIFEKFYQGDTSHAQEGNGLGLALVKKVIDVIGGKISVESEQGKGAKFTITLKTEE